MTPDDDRSAADAAFEAYRIVLELWSRENPIKTLKLQVLLAVNAVLIAVATASGDGLTADEWPLYAAGAMVSAIWTLSIGRTTLFQAAWDRKLDDFAARFPDDERFRIHQTRAERARAPRSLRTMGGISSKWYLTFSPPAFAIVWLVILIVTQR